MRRARRSGGVKVVSAKAVRMNDYWSVSFYSSEKKLRGRGTHSVFT